VVGAHPLPLDRATAYVRKAMREAKEHTSWTAPDPAYESAVEDFVAGVLADQELMSELGALVADIDLAAHVNALAQLTLRVTLPGFPDTYQGTETWDDSLVDPDNRRPVDFAMQRRMLDHARDVGAVEAWRDERPSGLPKLVVLDRLLHLRQRRPDAFGSDAAYDPIAVADDRAIAFVRGGNVLIMVPRLTLAGVGPTELALPAGEWREVFTERIVNSSGDLLSTFPVAVLERA
jgi:(1->4)-alpha-D-glucan 1-alpha-D-glucosylmutase